MDASSKNRAVAEEQEYDELEELHAQMNGEEEKLATLTSDLDMLRTRSDALARARQVGPASLLLGSPSCVALRPVARLCPNEVRPEICSSIRAPAVPNRGMLAKSVGEELVGTCKCADAEGIRLANLPVRAFAGAPSRQMLEEEERAQQRRLEHLQLLQQLRKLQDMEPWAALQAASPTSRACENVAPNTRSSTELMKALKQPAAAVRSQSSSVSVSSRCNAPLPPKSPQTLPWAASPSEPHRMQPDAANEILESPANDTQCNSPDRGQASDGSVSVLSKPRTAPADSSQQIYPSTAAAGAAAAAEDSMLASASAVEGKARSSKPNKRANEEVGPCAQGVGGKKARQNPMGFLCKFQVPFETHHRSVTFATHVLFHGRGHRVLPLASKDPSLWSRPKPVDPGVGAALSSTTNVACSSILGHCELGCGGK